MTIRPWMSSITTMIRFKMAARRPFCFFQLTRVQVRIFLRINLIFGIWVYQYQTLNEFANRHDRIQNGRPAAILVTSVTTFRLKNFFFSNRFNIVHRGCLWPKMLNKLKNHVHEIQNGRRAAILFVCGFSVDTLSSPHFFLDHSHT